MSHSKFFTGALDQKISDDLHLAGMSERPHAGYLRAVRKLADDCQRPPDRPRPKGGNRSSSSTSSRLATDKVGDGQGGLKYLALANHFKIL